MTTDAADWALALDGQGEAFGRVFDRHRDRVFRHVVRLVASPSDADDAVATTFLEAWRRRDSVRFVDDSVLPWLLVTATNVASNLRRSARRHRALLDRLPVERHEPDHAASFDDEAQRALRSLSTADQRVVTLCVLHGLSERDAATVLGVPPGTVKSRLSRAKARLAAQWVAEPPAPAASSALTAAMKDAIVTRDEYLAGFDRFVACMTGAGYDVDGGNRDAVILSYSTPGAVYDDGTDLRCYLAEFGPVDDAWQTAHVDENFTTEMYRLCLTDAGITPLPTRTEIDQQFVDNGIDPLTCMP